MVRKNVRARADWPPTVMSGHLTWAADEERKGHLLVSGPIADGSGGIYLIRAETSDEAEKIARDDPAIQSGCCSYALHEWDIRRGRELFA